MRQRRLVIRDVSQAIVKSIDISDIDHANAMMYMTMSIETMCDMGEWHINQVARLDPWGERITR